LPAALMLYGVSAHYFNTDFGKTDYKAAIDYMVDHTSGKATVVCIPSFVCDLVRYNAEKSKQDLFIYKKNDVSVAHNNLHTLWSVERKSNTRENDYDFPGYKKIVGKNFKKENGLRVQKWSKDFD